VPQRDLRPGSGPVGVRRRGNDEGVPGLLRPHLDDGKPELMKGDTTGIADDYLADFFPSQRPPKQPRRDYGQREADALSRAWTGGLGDA